MLPQPVRLLLSVTVAAAALSCESGSNPTTPVGPVARIQFVADTFAVDQGRTTTVSAIALDANGQPVPGATIVYSPINGAIAAVSASGTVSGVKPGPTGVRASVGAISADAAVEVFGHPEGLLIGSTPLTGRPYGVAISRSGIVYVTRLDAGAVSRLDTGLAVAEPIAVGNVPTAVVFSPDGKLAYVTNQHSQNVGVVDVPLGKQIATIPVPADPFVPFVSPDGSKLFVTSNTSNVFVVNTQTRAIADVITLTHAPNGVALHPDGKRIYVSASFGGTVHEIDIATDAVLRSWAPGGMPQGMVVSRDGSELLVANEQGWVDIYTLATGARAAQVSLAGGGFGTALSPDQQHLYVSLPNRGKVQVLNIPSRNVIHTVDVGGAPRRIAFTRHGGVAVIPNEAGWVDFVR